MAKVNFGSDLTEVFKKGGVALAIRILNFLSGYLFIYLIVRYFGSETQGRLSLAFSIMIIGSLLARLGIDVHFVKVFAISGNIDNARGIYFKLAPKLLLLSGLLSAIVFFSAHFIAASFFSDPGLSIYIQWTAPCIFLYTFTLIHAAIFRGLRFNTIYVFLFNGGRFMFSLMTMAILLLVIGKDPLVTVIAHTVAITILFLISVRYLIKWVYPVVRTTDYQVSSFVRSSLPMLFSATMIVFLGWTDTIVLGVFNSSEDVGVYSVVLKIAAVVGFALQALDSILAPKLSKAFHDNQMATFKQLVKWVTWVNFVVSAGAILVIVLLRDFILNFFGPEFLVAEVALLLLCVGQLFNAICGPVGSILQMTGHQRAYQNILLVALGINFTLNLLLVQEYGLTGVAVATACSLVFWKVYGIIYIRKNIYK